MILIVRELHVVFAFTSFSTAPFVDSSTAISLQFQYRHAGYELIQESHCLSLDMVVFKQLLLHLQIALSELLDLLLL